MSSDNGVYILQSKDGWRVIHAQAIDNLYWHNIKECCGKPNEEVINDQERCKLCNKFLLEKKEELSSNMLKEYFGKCKIFTKEEVMEKAEKLHDEYTWTEYGICFVRGWEDKEFPI